MLSSRCVKSCARYAPPVSSTTTRLPARANADATTPPPAPLPITTTSARTRSPLRAVASGKGDANIIGAIVARTGIADALPERILIARRALCIRQKEREAFQRGKSGLQPIDRRRREKLERRPAHRIGSQHRQPEQVEQLEELSA